MAKVKFLRILGLGFSIYIVRCSGKIISKISCHLPAWLSLDAVEPKWVVERRRNGKKLRRWKRGVTLLGVFHPSRWELSGYMASYFSLEERALGSSQTSLLFKLASHSQFPLSNPKYASFFFCFLCL